MRVRVLKACLVDGRRYQVGQIAYLNEGVARSLSSRGIVMEDKSLDGAPEAKGTHKGRIG